MPGWASPKVASRQFPVTRGEARASSLRSSDSRLVPRLLGYLPRSFVSSFVGDSLTREVSLFRVGSASLNPPPFASFVASSWSFVSLELASLVLRATQVHSSATWRLGRWVSGGRASRMQLRCRGLWPSPAFGRWFFKFYLICCCFLTIESKISNINLSKMTLKNADFL